MKLFLKLLLFASPVCAQAQAQNIVVNVVVSTTTATSPQSPPAVLFTPSPGAYLAGQQVLLTDANPTTAIHYTTDGTAPSTGSAAYTAPIVLTSGETIRAMAIAGGLSSPASSAAYTVAPPHLVFSTQPVDTVAGATLNPAPAVSIVDSGGNLLSGSAASITLALTGTGGTAMSGSGAAQGTLVVAAVNGTATFSNLSIPVAGSGYNLVATSSSWGSVTSSAFAAVGPTMTISLGQTQINIGKSSIGTVTLSQPAPAGGVTVALSSSSPAAVSVGSATLTIPAGNTSATFFYNGLTVGTTSISATAPGLSAVAPMTVAMPVATSSFFGLTVLNFQNVTAPLSYGTARTWDAHPGLDWADANPSPGVYNFDPLDSFISINTGQGRQTVYTFGRTPQWASTNPTVTGSYGPGQCAPPLLSAWDAYVTAIVTHSAGRIKYWELWNEPDQIGFYCGDIPTMVTMAQHAYSIIKGIDPSAVVFSPTTTGGAGTSWLEQFITLGGQNNFDAVAFHGYEGNQAESINAIAGVYRTVMNRHNLQAMQLWDTECSWGESNIGDDAHRAAFLSKYMLLQWSDGVDRVLWYAYDGDPGWGRLIDSNGALLPDGIAYGQTYSWMNGATLTQPCAVDGNGTWTCSLSRSGGYQAQVVWNSTTTTTASYTVPASMVEYRSLSGSVTALTGRVVAIDNNPILLESAPLP